MTRCAECPKPASIAYVRQRDGTIAGLCPPCYVAMCVKDGDENMGDRPGFLWRPFERFPHLLNDALRLS